MLIIGIDARFAVHNRRGIGNYTLKLIQNLAEIDSNNEYILYIDRDDLEYVLPNQRNFKIKKLCPSNYLIWEQFVLPMQAKKDNLDILHCTGNTAPLYLYGKITLILTIQDVMYLKPYFILPRSTSLYQRLGRIYRKMIVPKAIKHVSRVITISNFSKKDIMEHIPSIKEDSISVIYLAANNSFKVVNKDEAITKLKEKFGINGSYILAFGGIDPRKNTELIINMFIESKRKEQINEKLVIVGIPNWKQAKFYNIVQESEYRDDIIFTNFVSEEDLVLLYNSASVFLYPSLYEGFGIPPLEAMACGVPVITSNTTSIPEIVGDAALLINPQNGEELKEALLTILNDKNLRYVLISRGFEQVKKFSWQKMAEKTLEVYNSVYRGVIPKKKTSY
ncbi:glycosyltransferase family 1 protein [Desulfosporosinus sp.]|uniref:glycosyltransferase family 4 protein n=1 Tax=Desulfosporosinus sp. TaxID=157907 RepID=UPI002614DDD7|nr:glycosyltransferase family 1 protein [Desulfosporosinus sp.]